MDDETTGRLAGLLVGATCTGVGVPNGQLHAVFGSRGLHVGSAWRVVHEGEIVAGSDTAPDLAEKKLMEALVGHTVRTVSTHGAFNDLHLHFDCGPVLETFANAEGYEHWQLAGGPDEMIVAGTGPLWSSF